MTAADRAILAFAPPAVNLQRLAMAWSCLRRNRESGRGCERMRLVLTLHPLDHAHAVLEAWSEVAGNRPQQVLAPTVFSMTCSSDERLTHVDVHDHDGRRVLAVSLLNTPRRVLYAQSPLLAQAALTGGVYDPPAFCDAPDQRAAQSA